ncbi:MAG: NUDIX domain-containing protein [Phycisphaerae bacterium]|nr:NUDIX domain-containing protein [Phycisphaerae bacterium]
MPLKPVYCSQCGHSVTTREVEGRPRAVCPACETVFYENPLPVAASIVLNDRREVLLVKRAREPQKGEWCLPMGFAERGETITEAALRELKEETGIDGRVLQMIDTDSYESEHYGDLLIVSFEMKKNSGEEHAGDDAEEVRYFPIGRHPPLAFSSNEKALRACAAAHLEDWAIQDSFVTLEADEDKAMLSDAVVELIEERAEEIAFLWLDDVRSNPTTRTYKKLDPELLRAGAVRAISQFSRWFKGDGAADEVAKLYQAIGRERRAQGFKLREVLSAIALLKKHVWIFARAHGVWERPIDVYRVLELNRLMAVFFDKATYHTVRGFDEE